MVHNSGSTVQGIANQTDVINEKTSAVAEGIANQTEVIVGLNEQTRVVAAAIANQTEVIVGLNEQTRAVAAAIANQSDLINEKTSAVAEGIANQSDLIRLKLDALIRVMHELRQIQKAQLAMQREASEVIRQLGTPSPQSAQLDKRPGGAEYPLHTGTAKPALKS
jgi:ABC-type transporter Mla subunit MlaD